MDINTFMKKEIQNALLEISNLSVSEAESKVNKLFEGNDNIMENGYLSHRGPYFIAKLILSNLK